MCGRYSLASNAEDLAELFSVSRMPAGFTARYNIAPTQRSIVVHCDADGDRQAAFFRWGLIPFWAKEASIGPKMINARAETLSRRPAFRRAFREQRCAIPASGFYEWFSEAGQKKPVYFTLNTGQPFGLAGLWELWNSPQGALHTFTIITTAANSVVKPIHHRMPVILRTREEIDRWLDHSDAQELLAPRIVPGLWGYEVAPRVNSAAHDDLQCSEPLAAGRVIKNQAHPPT